MSPRQPLFFFFFFPGMRIGACARPSALGGAGARWQSGFCRGLWQGWVAVGREEEGEENAETARA